MSSSKNRRIKNRRQERRENESNEKYMQKVKDDHINERAEATVRKGIINHALTKEKKPFPDHVYKKKKKNKSLVDKFKRLLKLKI